MLNIYRECNMCGKTLETSLKEYMQVVKRRKIFMCKECQDYEDYLINLKKRCSYVLVINNKV